MQLSISQITAPSRRPATPARVVSISSDQCRWRNPRGTFPEKNTELFDSSRIGFSLIGLSVNWLGHLFPFITRLLMQYSSTRKQSLSLLRLLLCRVCRCGAVWGVESSELRGGEDRERATRPRARCSVLGHAAAAVPSVCVCSGT